MPNTTPGRLATELGIPPMEMFRVMEEMRLNVKRMSARLTPTQEQALRSHFRNTAAYRERRLQRALLEPLSAPRPVGRPALREFPKTCVCCDRRWIHRAEEDTPTRLCAECTGHYEQVDETDKRKIERAESHASIYKRERDLARSSFEQAYRERTVAYESRAKWLAAVAEVVLDHDEGPDGLCWCGERIPCRTWRKLGEANKGIHRQVEKWSSWSDKRLEEFLYGEDRANRRVVDEDVTATDTAEEGGSEV